MSTNEDLAPLENYLHTQVDARMSAFGNMSLRLEGESGQAVLFDPSFPAPVVRTLPTSTGALTYSEQTPQLVADLNNFCNVVVPATPIPPPPGLCPPAVTPGQLATARVVARRIEFRPQLDEATVRWAAPNPALFPAEVPGSPVMSISFPVTYDFRQSQAMGLFLLDLESPEALDGRGEILAIGSFAGNVLWRLAGPASGGHFGASMATASEWLVVGAPAAPGPAGNPGAVLLHAFVDGMPVQMRAVGGKQDGERFGTSVTSGGDLTGDGVAEVLVGAPLATTDAGLGAGRVDVLTLDGQELRSFEGPVSGARVGSDASAILPTGQLPGGVLVGAPDASAGAGLVVFFLWDGSVLWTRDGAAGDALGASLGQAADFDLDGIAELAVGAPGADGNRGRVLVLDTLGTEVASLTVGDSLYFGAHVTVPGDVNGDGFADLLVSTPSFDGDSALDDSLFFTYLGAGLQRDPVHPPPFAE